MDMPKPSVEVLKKRVPNVFVMVNLLGKRARELATLSTPGERKEENLLKVVLKELEEGKIAPKEKEEKEET